MRSDFVGVSSKALNVGQCRSDSGAGQPRFGLPRLRRRLGSVLVTALVLVSPATVEIAHAATIGFEAIDLSDTTPGQDLWRYVYTVDGSSFAFDQGLAIFFDYTAYGPLLGSSPDTDPGAFVSTNSDWDILLLDPEIGLLADGVFDALALVGSPISSVLSVDFLWSGLGTPGSQSFSTYQLDAFGTPQILESGVTTAVTPVPEPGTLLLLLGGCAGMSALRARQRLMRSGR